MSNNPNTLFCAVYTTEFPGQSILRLRPDLQSLPVVVMDGSPPHESVCALNLHARKRGIVKGLLRHEIEEMEGIQILARSPETERAARTVLLECCSQFSPRIEETTTRDVCGFVLDIAGTERLFGSAEKLAHSIRNATVSCGFRVSIAISINFHTARIKAEYSRGISIIAEGQEAYAVAGIPVSALTLDEDHYSTFAIWGIRTLGELAELPDEELIARMGQQALFSLHLSRGLAAHTFQPVEATFQLQEHIDFEIYIEQLDSLLFIGADMINKLVTRACRRALCIASLKIEMSLEGIRGYNRVIRPAIPSNDPKFLLKLLQLEIAAHPPSAAIVSLTLTAEAGQKSNVQLTLFTPPSPEPSRLDVTIARLKALVGADRVGSPVVSDTHQSGSFVMNDFVLEDSKPVASDNSFRASLRRLRPPHPVQVRIKNQKPTFIRDCAECYSVQVAYGPWHSNGNWWAIDKWDTEEWDVLAINNYGENVSCLLVQDHLKKQWLLDAFYD